MFVTKGCLNAYKERYESQIEEMSTQYEARIQDLKSQITDLKQLVYSSTSARNIPLVSLEADAVLSQKEETIEISEEDLMKLQEEESEADRILSGNY